MLHNNRPTADAVATPIHCPNNTWQTIHYITYIIGGFQQQMGHVGKSDSATVPQTDANYSSGTTTSELRV